MNNKQKIEEFPLEGLLFLLMGENHEIVFAHLKEQAIKIITFIEGVEEGVINNENYEIARLISAPCLMDYFLCFKDLRKDISHPWYKNFYQTMAKFVNISNMKQTSFNAPFLAITPSEISLIQKNFGINIPLMRGYNSNDDDFLIALKCSINTGKLHLLNTNKYQQNIGELIQYMKNGAKIAEEVLNREVTMFSNISGVSVFVNKDSDPYRIFQYQQTAERGIIEKIVKPYPSEHIHINDILPASGKWGYKDISENKKAVTT